jgi:hypothetical protein
MAWIRRVLVAAGLGIVVAGATGALRDPLLSVQPWARYLAIISLFADVLVIPVALLFGAVTARLLPPWIRLPVQGALYCSAAIIVVATPLVLGYGRDPALPSALPRDYGRNLVIVLGVVWLCAAVIVLARRPRRRPAALGAPAGSGTESPS